MTVRLAVVMDPIADISYKKDSSLAMLLAARKLGWELWYCEQPDLYLDHSRAMGLLRPLDVRADGEAARRGPLGIDGRDSHARRERGEEGGPEKRQ